MIIVDMFVQVKSTKSLRRIHDIRNEQEIACLYLNIYLLIVNEFLYACIIYVLDARLIAS